MNTGIKKENEEKPSQNSKFEQFKKWVQQNDRSTSKISIPDHTGFSFKKLYAFLGPGFLIAIAYIDPGNFATDIRAGAGFNYRMIWVLLFATTMGLFLQVLSARLGLVTRKHLASVCREEYGTKTPLTIVLWLITESAIIASDIPEIIGTAFALNMLFGIPLWLGVLITGVDTMIFLALQYFGMRYLEAFIAGLVAIISFCFVVELWLSPVRFFESQCPEDWCSNFTTQECPSNYCGAMIGGLLPRINGENVYIAISLLGAVVMPHNLYLHSALVHSREIKPTPAAIREANKYNWIESTIALSFSTFVNICIVSVAAANFYPSKFNNFSLQFSDPDLDDTAHLLGNFLGKSASIVFAIALLASGQSSTLTGTFAGQFVMEGFVEIKLPLWQRNLITRSIAILPSLIVALIAGKNGSTTLMILSSATLSFQLPFALIPLLKFTASPKKMGEFANSKAVTIFMGMLGVLVCAANVYLIFDTLYGEEGFISGIENTAGKVLLTILVVIGGLVYFSLLIYLVYRPLRMKEYPIEKESLLSEDDSPLQLGSHELYEIE